MATIVDGVLNTIQNAAGVFTKGGQPSSQGYIMALDAGTTSVRAILFDEYGMKVAQAQRPITVTFPNPGWVEQDPVEILSRQIACMIEVQFTSGIHSDRIRAVGITNQRETVVVWDRRTGKPVCLAGISGDSGFPGSHSASRCRRPIFEVLDPFAACSVFRGQRPVRTVRVHHVRGKRIDYSGRKAVCHRHRVERGIKKRARREPERYVGDAKAGAAAKLGTYSAHRLQNHVGALRLGAHGKTKHIDHEV